MTFTQIQYFLTSAKTLSFTEAANQLFVTQPALSRQITALEAELNMQLFVRTGNGIKLTPASSILYEELNEFMANFNNIFERAKMVNEGKRGSLTIGLINDHDMSSIIPGALKHLKSNYPDINVSLCCQSYENILSSLHDDSIDIAITYCYSKEVDTSLNYRLIYSCDPYVAVAKSSPLYNFKELTLKNIKDNDTTILTKQEVFEEGEPLAKKLLSKETYYPNLKFVDDFSTALLWLDSDNYCAFLNTGMLYMRSPQLSYIPLKDFPKTDVALVWNKECLNPSIHPFIKYLTSLKYE